MWKRTGTKNVIMYRGPGSSPVIYKNLLILHYEALIPGFLVALDKSDEEVVWRTIVLKSLMNHCLKLEEKPTLLQ